MSMTPEKRSQAHPALGYDCPFCGAPAGEGCHTKTGAARATSHPSAPARSGGSLTRPRCMAYEKSATTLFTSHAPSRISVVPCRYRQETGLPSGPTNSSSGTWSWKRIVQSPKQMSNAPPSTPTRPMSGPQLHTVLRRARTIDPPRSMSTPPRSMKRRKPATSATMTHTGKPPRSTATPRAETAQQPKRMNSARTKGRARTAFLFAFRAARVGHWTGP